MDKLTPLPTPAPSRADPANFSNRGDALMTALPTMVDQLNTAIGQIDTAQTTATTAAGNATAAANAAAAAAGATPWNSATNYTQYTVVISPLNFQPYRCKAAGVSAIDPALDPDKWVPAAGAIPVETLHAAMLSF